MVYPEDCGYQSIVAPKAVHSSNWCRGSVMQDMAWEWMPDATEKFQVEI